MTIAPSVPVLQVRCVRSSKAEIIPSPRQYTAAVFAEALENADALRCCYAYIKVAVLEGTPPGCLLMPAAFV